MLSVNPKYSQGKYYTITELNLRQYLLYNFMLGSIHAVQQGCWGVRWGPVLLRVLTLRREADQEVRDCSRVMQMLWPCRLSCRRAGKTRQRRQLCLWITLCLYFKYLIAKSIIKITKIYKSKMAYTATISSICFHLFILLLITCICNSFIFAI